MSNAALYDAPWDFTRNRESHRFPAATYLRRDVAADERAHAERSLHAVNDAASVRIGLAGGLTLGLVVAVAAVVIGSDGLAGVTVAKLAVLGGLLLALVAALVGMIRRHTFVSGALMERLGHYDARLAELDERRAAREAR
jgi:hypothetical protein